jgi:hypothetical protein
VLPTLKEIAAPNFSESVHFSGRSEYAPHPAREGFSCFKMIYLKTHKSNISGLVG